MTVTINGTSGITTPSVNSTGSNTLGDNVADTLNVGNGAIVTDSSGNVGIGTSSPAKKLHVYTAVDTPAQFESSGTTSYIRFANSGASNGYVGYNSSSAMEFLTAGSERMRIDSSGNLLVGKTTEAAANNGFAATPSSGFRATAATGNYNICNVSGASTTQTLIQFRYNDSPKGGISCDGSTITYNTTSDYRLKEDVQQMQNALDTVSQLNPVTYKWKENGKDGQGFIAHELQAVVPDCVTGDKDAVDEEGNPVYQGIDTSFLVATLTKAIQEQQAQIETLTAKVAALETK